MPTSQVPWRLIQRQNEGGSSQSEAFVAAIGCFENGQFRGHGEVGELDHARAGVDGHQHEGDGGGPQRSVGAARQPVPAPVDEEHVGGESEPGDEINSAQTEGLVAEPVGNLGEPFPVDPALPDRGEGVGIGLDEVMGSEKKARVGQVPPDIGVNKEGTCRSSTWMPRPWAG